VDGRRDHSFRVPRPDLSVTIGTPNACTNYHADEAADWAAAEVAARFPDGRTGTPHYGETLHAGRTAPSLQTRDELLALASDTSEPAIVRATALDLLRPMANEDALARAKPLLSDDRPLVRAATLRLFQAAPPERRVQVAAGLLDDPAQSVRIEAAKLLIGQPIGALSGEQRKSAQTALAAYQRSLFARADYPETQMQIAGVAMMLRNFGAAQNALKEAIRMDPQLADAWITLARIEAALGRPANAVQTLQRAAEQVPQNASVFRHLGGLHAQTGRHAEAIAALERSLSLSGASPELLEMLAIEHFAAGDRQMARDYANRLAREFPAYQPQPRTRQLMQPD
jgi:Tfp pilus assembly protein PilF